MGLAGTGTWAGLHLGDRLPAQELHSLVVENHAVIADDTVVAVRVVGVQRHIGVHLQQMESCW